MKEIEFDGIEVKGRLSGRIIGGGEVSISKVSSEGMLFETINQLKPRSHYKFEVTFGDEKAALSAGVVNVLWKHTIEKDKRQYTLYQVAVEFEHLKDNEKTFLDSMIDELLEDKISTFFDKKGIKIQIKD
ncbi:MAG: hypothetical protein V3R54_02680 [Thermodesulfovibrionia bacterium]